MSVQAKNGKQLTNFDIHLERIYQSPNEPSSLTLCLIVTQGTRQQSLSVSYDKLGQLDIQRLIPGCVYLTPKAKSEVVKQILLLAAHALQEKTKIGMLYSQSGWYNLSSGRIFVAGGAVISDKGIASSTTAFISDEIRQLHLAVNSKLTPAQSSELLLQNLITYGDYAIPTYAYALYGILHSIWPEANMPTACVLNLIGTQGFGKTTLARNFCALYNDASGHIADFYDAQSSAASMRNALGEAKDRIIVIDDLCKSTSPSEMKSRRDLIAKMIRIGANESPISRVAGGKTITTVCQSGLVLTGELPLESASDITRCVIINVEQPLRNGSPDERIIAATATAAYIQWLCAHFTEELERIKSDFRRFCERDPTKNLWRLKKSLFQLDWVFGSFLRFAKSAGSITEAEQQLLEKRSGDIFQKIFSYEEALVRNAEFAQPSQWKQLILEGGRTNAFPYTQKPGCICVRPADLTRFLRTILHMPALQEREVIAKLKSQNLLLMDKSGKSTKKVSGIRMLHINTAN